MFQFKQISDQIYVLSFDSPYDLGMHFLRYQEFYECPNPEFRGRNFTIVDYMQWYAKEKGKDNFTYCTDWTGFNIPSWVLTQLLRNYSGIPFITDRNKYDDFMENLLKLIIPNWDSNNYDHSKKDKFYIIGCLINDEDAMQHELAHALYYTNNDYKEKMDELLEVNKPLIDCLSQQLLDSGYCEDVLLDECQAYLSTGLTNEQKKYLRLNRVKSVASICKEFNKIFQTYQKELLK